MHPGSKLYIFLLYYIYFSYYIYIFILIMGDIFTYPRRAGLATASVLHDEETTIC